MIKKALILALVATALTAAELKPVKLAQPRFEGDGDFQKKFFIKVWYEKTPEFIFDKFKKNVNFREKDSAGFPRWTFRRSVDGKEDLAKYKCVVVDNRWVIEGRMVWSFQADFYKPINSKEPWRSWSVSYLLLPKGVDYHKEQEKIANEKF
tara:strand:+ start:363 stop:815 length:453 start_codon:yes stop_codon:yes gene_type:complete